MTNLTVSRNKWIKQGELLFQINPEKTWWLEADIPESDMNWIDKSATFEVRNYNGTVNSIPIDFISPRVDAHKELF